MEGQKQLQNFPVYGKDIISTMPFNKPTTLSLSYTQQHQNASLLTDAVCRKLALSPHSKELLSIKQKADLNYKNDSLLMIYDDKSLNALQFIVSIISTLIRRCSVLDQLTTLVFKLKTKHNDKPLTWGLRDQKCIA